MIRRTPSAGGALELAFDLSVPVKTVTGPDTGIGEIDNRRGFCASDDAEAQDLFGGFSKVVPRSTVRLESVSAVVLEKADPIVTSACFAYRTSDGQWHGGQRVQDGADDV